MLTGKHKDVSADLFQLILQNLKMSLPVDSEMPVVLDHLCSCLLESVDEFRQSGISSMQIYITTMLFLKSFSARSWPVGFLMSGLLSWRLSICYWNRFSL